jgi:hypothetical protein
MRRFITAFLVAIAAIPASALAITGNYVKDTEHPFVGLVVFYDAAGQFIWRCSGSLISPTKLLTAGHCADTAEGAASARVYFQQDAGVHYDPATQHDPVTGYPDSCAPARSASCARPRAASTTTASPTSPASRTRTTPAS